MEKVTQEGSLLRATRLAASQKRISDRDEAWKKIAAFSNSSNINEMAECTISAPSHQFHVEQGHINSARLSL